MPPRSTGPTPTPPVSGPRRPSPSPHATSTNPPQRHRRRPGPHQPTTTPASTHLPDDPPTPEAITSDRRSPPALNVPAPTAPAELVDDDVQATPLTPGDVATQFTLAALNDRYDTPLDDRRLTLAAWATPDVVAQWAERLTDTQRDRDTVRSASATTVSVTQVDDTTWAATVTAAVTESNVDGPTTVIDHQLELNLATVPDGLRVTAAAELVGP